MYSHFGLTFLTKRSIVYLFRKVQSVALDNSLLIFNNLSRLESLPPYIPNYKSPSKEKFVLDHFFEPGKHLDVDHSFIAPVLCPVNHEPIEE